MIVPCCARPADGAHATAHAAIAAAKPNVFNENSESLFPSMRNLLDIASIAQSLDGMAV